MKKTGIPIIIAAASGTGKTSLVKALVAAMDNLSVSISHTTRPKRSGEKNNVNYHFISKEEFERLIKEDAFLERAKVFDNFYGTSREWVEQQFAKGQDVIFEIDWQGAKQLREQLKSRAVSIFILPPSLIILEQRLHGRGQDGKTVIAKRMKEAKSEISHHREFDYIIVNDDFDTATEELVAIIKAERIKAHCHEALVANLLADFQSN